MGEDKLKKFVSENREAFDRLEPSPEIWNRVSAQISPAKKVKRNLALWGWSAAASILVLVSAGTMLFLGDRSPLGDANEVAVEVKKNPAERNSIDRPIVEDVHVDPDAMMLADRSNKSVKSRRDRVSIPKEKSSLAKQKDEHVVQEDALEQSAMILLADDRSAINRMEGVLRMRDLVEISPALMEQLQYTVMADPNSNVRFAALDVLMDNTPVQQREQRIQDVFVTQDDPTLQIELMQAMVVTDSLQLNAKTATRLQEITEDPVAIDFVKEQAYAVLMKNW